MLEYDQGRVVITFDPAGQIDLDAMTCAMEVAMLQWALGRERWVKARAARLLGITERQIAYKMRQNKLRNPRGAP